MEHVVLLFFLWIFEYFKEANTLSWTSSKETLFLAHKFYE